MPAIYVSRCIYYDSPIGRIADTQIVSCTRLAAKRFGYDDPRLLAGEYLSCLQPKDWREAGHQRYFDRVEGRKLGKDYAVVTRHPDGSLVGQRREFLGWLHSGTPYSMYLTMVRKATQIDHPPLRVLSREEQERYTQYVGDYTVADAARILADDTPDREVDNLEIFQDIIKQCFLLSSTAFADKYRSPLHLALSDDVTISWKRVSEKSEKTHPVLVRARFDCVFCGYRWYGNAGTTRRPQCGACGKNYAWT